MKHKVTVPWDNQSGMWWNETCAKVIEHFGLPGRKYRCETSTECLSFIFNNEKDAFMCKIMISESI